MVPVERIAAAELKRRKLQQPKLRDYEIVPVPRSEFTIVNQTPTVINYEILARPGELLVTDSVYLASDISVTNGELAVGAYLDARKKGSFVAKIKPDSWPPICATSEYGFVVAVVRTGIIVPDWYLRVYRVRFIS